MAKGNSKKKEESKTPAATEEAKTTSGGKKWPGRNHILCGGRAVVGPGKQPKFHFAVTVLTLPWPYFLFILVRYFQEENSPGPLIVAVILMVFVYCAMAATAFSDPGIIPRSPILRDTKATYTGEELPAVRLKGQKRSRLKFCQTCNIIRPPRASHCSICNCCISHFDHHCPYTGNCVGLRNYRYYLWFIFSLSLTCAYTLCFTLYHIFYLSRHFTASSSSTTLPTDSQDHPYFIGLLVGDCLLAAYAFIAGGLVTGLSCLHLYLCSNNIKTYEHIKKEFKTKANPYDQGIFRNWLWWWLGAPRWPKTLQAAIQADPKLRQLI